MVPTTDVLVFIVPIWTWRFLDISGSTAVMSPPAESRPFASEMFSTARSVPEATPPTRMSAGKTESSVVPSAEMRAFTDCCAPRPSATTAMTAPTPMTTPSIVRKDRSLLARSAPSATAMISPMRNLSRSIAAIDHPPGGLPPPPPPPPPPVGVGVVCCNPPPVLASPPRTPFNNQPT